MLLTLLPDGIEETVTPVFQYQIAVHMVEMLGKLDGIPMCILHVDFGDRDWHQTFPFGCPHLSILIGQ
jgi:hypothetical protein